MYVIIDTRIIVGIVIIDTSIIVDIVTTDTSVIVITDTIYYCFIWLLLLNSSINITANVISMLNFAGNLTANATIATIARLLAYRSMVRHEHIKPHVRVHK